MRKVFNWIWSILEVIIIVYVIAITSFILCKNSYGFTQFGDYTFHSINLVDERNNPKTKSGDLLIVKNSNDIHEGDLIYYYSVLNDNYIVKSEYVKKIQSDDYTTLYTLNEEGTLSVVDNRVLGKYATTYHSLGNVIRILESRIGFLFLVLLPIMIVFIYQVYEFVIIIRYERREKDDDSKDEKKPMKKEEKSAESTNDGIEVL